MFILQILTLLDNNLDLQLSLLAFPFLEMFPTYPPPFSTKIKYLYFILRLSLVPHRIRTLEQIVTNSKSKTPSEVSKKKNPSESKPTHTKQFGNRG